MKQDFILEASDIIKANLERLEYVDNFINGSRRLPINHPIPADLILNMLEAVTKSIYDTNAILQTMIDDEVSRNMS